MDHDEPIIEWRGKYQSEILMVCHMDAMAEFKLGLISEEEMKEYDQDCLLPEYLTAQKAGKTPEMEHITA